MTMRNMSKHGFNSSCLNSPKNVKARGFTILELVIAIAIAALLVALSIPNFTESIKNNRLASKANDLVLGFKVTRQTAISRSVPTFVCHSNNANTNTPTCGGGAGSDWNTGFVIYAAPIKTLTTAKRAYAPATDTLIQQIDLADDQDILVTDTNADSVVSFGSDGFLFDSPAVEMQICDDRNGENGYLIRVSLSGKTSRERAIAPNECT
jgi:type IV fimbrial biogenesis protein FimT